MNDAPDYYRILHVHPTAPREIVRSSYRTLMQRLKQHPDLGGDPARAALLNEAHEVLSDPQRRASYDAMREHARHRPRSPRPEPEPRKGVVYWPAYRASGTGRCGFCGARHGYGEALPEDAACRRCSSPLPPAPRGALSEDGRRALGRLAVRRPVDYHATPHGPAARGHSLDVSPFGMRFDAGADARLSRDQMLRIDCDICDAVVRVAHVDDHPSIVVGVEFVTLRLKKARGTFVSTRA